MKKSILAQVKKHGADLLTVFPLTTERRPVELCRKLRRIEARGSRLAMRVCNGPEMSEADQEAEEAAILAAADALLQFSALASKVPVVLNLDPRGYALKIGDEWTRTHAPAMYRDWGGYGIIAPEFQ